MKVLAIDPGYDRLGIAVLEGDPSRPKVLASDCVIPPKGHAEERLAVVSREVESWLTKHKPDVLGIEKLFFSKSVTSALGVAEARGAALAAAGRAHIPVIECSPQEVKLAVTGHGAADKKAIARMVPKLVALPSKARRLDDELDAIAVGIAALAMRFHV